MGDGWSWGTWIVGALAFLVIVLIANSWGVADKVFWLLLASNVVGYLEGRIQG